MKTNFGSSSVQRGKLRGCNGLQIKWSDILVRGWVLMVGLKVKVQLSWKNPSENIILQHGITILIDPAPYGILPILINGFL